MSNCGTIRHERLLRRECGFYLLQSNYFKKVSVDRTGGGVFPGFGNIDSLGTSASIDFQRGADSHPKIMGRGEQEMGGGGRRKSLERMWRWKNVV